MEVKVSYNEKIKETVSTTYMKVAKNHNIIINEINSLKDCQNLYSELIDKEVAEDILSNMREVNKLLYKNKNNNYIYSEKEFENILTFLENITNKEEPELYFIRFDANDSLKELKSKFEINYKKLFELVWKIKKVDYNQTFTTKNLENKIRVLQFKKVLTNIEFDNLFNILSITEEIDNSKVAISKDKMITYLSLLEDNYTFFEESQNYSISTENNLLRVLSYLADTSKEAIVNSEQFNDFKKYLHVKRPIEDVFINLMQKNVATQKSSLTLLCGSVGDGKSHLLAFSKSGYPELFNQIDIHNDATESIRPELTAIDTLEIILENFDDEVLGSIDQHLVLAINVGVLNNFIEKMKKKQKFQKLTKFVENSGLFDFSQNNNHEDGVFHLVSFFDNSPFEITSDGSQSTYYDDLFTKIFAEDKSNPFYKAYLADEQEKKSAQHNYNFRLLLNKEVQQTIKYLLIRIQIEYKNIISTRALFNFIYDIMVPNKDAKEKVTGYLPYLLFENKEKSSILNSIAKLDPVNIQNGQIDQLSIEIYNTKNYLERVKTYFKPYEFELINQIFSSISLDNVRTHKKSMSGFLRLKFLFEHNYELFIDKSYNTFMEHLSASKKDEAVNSLAALVRDSVYIWNGSPKKYHLFTNNKQVETSIAIAIEVRLVLKKVVVTNNTNYNILLRYTEITNSNKEYEIEIDYKLFKLLYSIKQGYFLKEDDKKQGVNFTEFIEEIINNTVSLSKTIVLDKDTGLLIELTDNGIEYEAEEV